MRKSISILSLVTGVILFMAFTKPVKKEIFKIDTEKSSIEWIGKKVTGQHNGTIKIASGHLELNNKTFKGGSFLIDMKSIVILDLKGEYNDKLSGHLKSDDFFSVEKNPTSKFEITKITPAGADRVNISGNLTIKGIKQPLSFPATIKKQDNTLVAVAKGIKVDRTKYDIKYGSKSFFSSIGDKAIDDEFELAINLVAKK